MLIELARVVPDGIVCFFVSYLYMDQVIAQWNTMNVLSDVMQHKLIFIETQVRVQSSFSCSFSWSSKEHRGSVLNQSRGRESAGCIGQCRLCFDCGRQRSVQSVLSCGCWHTSLPLL